MMSYLYVVIQFLMFIVIGVTGPIIPGNPYFLGVAVLGILLMAWSLWTMRPGNLNVMPELKAGSMLVTSGPYRLIRHPMYAAVLLVALALVLNHLTLLRVGYWLVLAIDLHFKLMYEEKLLLGKYPQYSDYKQKTKRLIPFIY
jgi:protein-S-isoprenylcysteine O-methyltransferase Ste14